MQCKFCGHNLPEGSISCTRCGGSLAEKTKTKIILPEARKEEFVFNIKPVFDPAVVMVRAFFISLLISAVITTTFGLMFYVILGLMGFLKCTLAFPFVASGSFLLSFFLLVYIAKKNTAARKFTFYQTKMEYTYNAFDGKFRYLEYSAILDSSVTKGPLQRMSNLGNISFVCVGTFHDYVVAIGDVREPDYTYKKIMDLIEIRKSML